ncbi:MAG: phosphate ABC transporter ATP-binding protein PstB [Oscillospiraceae bacterium]|jgi:phosphate transport system ATP-binding protein|nr:phosphate ABC transporter ATP-binding protein PstB [Oscillospiraceae bacterium]
MDEKKIKIKNLNLFFGNTKVLKNINIDIFSNNITTFIGPSGCGKTTCLRCLNRMMDMNKNCRVTGEILIDGINIYSPDINVTMLRQNIGMVFQKPNLFPKNIYDNIVYGPRVRGIRKRQLLDKIVKKTLESVGLWEALCERLSDRIDKLSGGQQQRLCIARAIATSPEIILMDEPTSALDPISKLKIEDLIDTLREKYTIIVVTHDMQQATRISDRTAFFLDGEIIEYDYTCELFNNPKEKKTNDYLTGRYDP